jgi:hypothetical protein
MKSIDKYLEVLEIKEEFISLNEVEFSQLISMLTPETKTKTLVKKINSSINKKDPVKTLKTIKNILSFLPDISSKKIDSFIKSKIPDFIKLKQLANTILKNSLPGTSDNVIDYASSFLVVSSFIVEKRDQNIQPKENLKKRLKEFVLKTRKFMDENEPEEEKSKKGGGFQKEDLPDLAVAWVIVIMSTAFMTGIGTGFYFILVAAAANITTIFFIILALVFIVVVAKTVPIIVSGSM